MESLFYNLTSHEYRLNNGIFWEGDRQVSNSSLPQNVHYAYDFSTKLAKFLKSDDRRSMEHHMAGFSRIGAFIFIDEAPPSEAYGLYEQQVLIFSNRTNQ